eukprot:UN31407
MMGKPFKQALGEMGGVVERSLCMIDFADECLADEILPQKTGFFRKIVKEPVGTVLTIAPWNYPLMCTINSVIPAILAGNSVILKLSGRTPLVADWFEKVFDEAGAPEHLLQKLHASHATIDEVIQHHSIGYVNFTGSVGGGNKINQSAARRKFIDTTLELGGKDPAIVLDDCDLDAAVECVVDGAFYNAGQSCCGM